jgi:hypothetical protein
VRALGFGPRTAGSGVDDRSPPERLSDNQYVILLLRLVVDRQDHLVQGEVGPVEDDQDVQHWVRFRGADGLLGAVQVCLAGLAYRAP